MTTPTGIMLVLVRCVFFSFYCGYNSTYPHILPFFLFFLSSLRRLLCHAMRWRQDHEVHRRWVALVDDENPDDVGIQGYLQLSIAVVGPGDKLKVCAIYLYHGAPSVAYARRLHVIAAVAVFLLSWLLIVSVALAVFCYLRVDCCCCCYCCCYYCCCCAVAVLCLSSLLLFFCCCCFLLSSLLLLLL